MNTPLYFNQRTLGNDLKGELAGSVLFAQASVLPSRASPIPGDVQPRLVSGRSALILFKPQKPVLPTVGITLKIGSDTSPWLTQAMDPPAELPPVAERETDAEYGRIVYGDGFWSATVPGSLIQPGNQLLFETAGVVGTYDNLDAGAPTELLLHTIDIGMLTPHRPAFIDTFTADLHRQYYQTIPCSRLIVNQYEPIDFPDIALPGGKTYTERSDDEGDWHNGDLREMIGNHLVSLGINSANLGIHSSPGRGDAGIHFVTAQVTAHSSVGNYRNGRVIHGGTGWKGMATLDNVTGNEFSHELGHNFGIHDYPGGFAGCVHRPAGSPNSAWGWNSDHKVFIPNFMKSRNDQDTCEGGQCQAPFHGHPFGRDAMGGGEPFYTSINRYTQHTPFSLQGIQRFLEGQAVFSETSSTGFMQWDERSKRMVEWADVHNAGLDQLDQPHMVMLLRKHRRVDVNLTQEHWAANVHIPVAGYVNNGRGVRVVNDGTGTTVIHVNGARVELKRGGVLNYQSDATLWRQVETFAGNLARKPEQQGVAVTTLLGFYDPQASRPGKVYPALHAAYGMTHAGEGEAEAIKARCYAVITGKTGDKRYFVLRGSRLSGMDSNCFHINVPQSFSPTHIRIVCDGTENAAATIAAPKGTARVSFIGRD